MSEIQTDPETETIQKLTSEIFTRTKSIFREDNKNTAPYMERSYENITIKHMQKFYEKPEMVEIKIKKPGTENEWDDLSITVTDLDLKPISHHVISHEKSGTISPNEISSHTLTDYLNALDPFTEASST